MIDAEKIWRVSPKGRKKDSFVLFYQTIDAVLTAFQNDTCKLGLWFYAIYEYELYGKEPSFEGADPSDVPILQAMFEITRSQLEINHKKWLITCKRNKDNATGGKDDNSP